MTASDADRAKAAEVLSYLALDSGQGALRTVRLEAIAAALAEARATERAAADQLRADVEKLAAEFDSAPVGSIYPARGVAAELRALLDGSR
jgi:hypothetical protein